MTVFFINFAEVKTKICKMKKIILFITLILLSSAVFTQVAPDKYYVQFTDKNNSPYSIDQPEDFLSQRAIDRRIRFDISVTEQDFPVNPQYLQGVAATGVTMLNPSKWLNGVTIYTTIPGALDDINELPYVEHVLKAGRYNQGTTKPKPYFEAETYSDQEKGDQIYKSVSEFDYGEAYNQINMISGISLHNDGYQGQGIIIAILDAGWLGTDVNYAFDSLFANDQILGTRDFVDHSNTVYDYHTHGTSVLSTMGANVPGEMVGTAPKADFWLLRSEESYGGYPENIIEEYNWVSAAEFADSVGADIINSSLGYTTFDDPAWDHTYEDMDGMTTVITRGADIASSKGLLVVNSAGNSGSNPWYYIGAPADGFEVFTIGAVDPSGNLASFSSHGPTYDGRIKPNIVAQGGPAYVASGSGGFTWGSGTSFSSPIIAGMSACLWQAHPMCSNTELMATLQQSASKATDPDNDYGYGIPDYELANSIMNLSENPVSDELVVFPNPLEGDRVNVNFNAKDSGDVVIKVFDEIGRLVKIYNLTLEKAGQNLIIIDNLSGISKGIYFLSILQADRVVASKFIK